MQAVDLLPSLNKINWQSEWTSLEVQHIPSESSLKRASVTHHKTHFTQTRQKPNEAPQNSLSRLFTKCNGRSRGVPAAPPFTVCTALWVSINIITQKSCLISICIGLFVLCWAHYIIPTCCVCRMNFWRSLDFRGILNSLNVVWRSSDSPWVWVN